MLYCSSKKKYTKVKIITCTFLLFNIFNIQNIHANEIEYKLEHPLWTDTITPINSSFCRSNGDCGTIEQINSDKILLKWEITNIGINAIF